MATVATSVDVYEVELEGFNGGTDSTDHLVRWGYADSLEAVQAQFPNSKVSKLEDEFVVSEGDIDFDLRATKAKRFVSVEKIQFKFGCENADCPEADFYLVTPSDLIDGGTPCCPLCGDEMEMKDDAKILD